MFYFLQHTGFFGGGGWCQGLFLEVAAVTHQFETPIMFLLVLQLVGGELTTPRINSLARTFFFSPCPVEVEECSYT